MGHAVWAMLAMMGFWASGVLSFGYVWAMWGMCSGVSGGVRRSPTCSVELFNALDYARPLTAGTSPLTCTDY